MLKEVLELTHQMKRTGDQGLGKKMYFNEIATKIAHQTFLCGWCLDSRLCASLINTNWLETHLCTSLFLISMTVLLDSRKKFLDINNQFPNYYPYSPYNTEGLIKLCTFNDSLFSWTVFSNCNKKRKRIINSWQLTFNGDCNLWESICKHRIYLDTLEITPSRN